MNLVLFYSLSFSVLISLSSGDESLNIYEQPMVECAPANCGHVTNISYPFWVENQQTPYCGIPSFKLTCHNQILIVAELTTISLQVKNIFYDNRSVLVVDETLVGSKCGYRHWSFLSDVPLFSISEANKNLVFLFDCSLPQPQFHKINCTIGNNTTYAAWETDLNSFGTCNHTDMPVAGYVEDNISNYMRAVKYGFLLDWPATDCERCRNSNGSCGYGETYAGFMCICPDGPHPTTCHSGPSEKKLSLKLVMGNVAIVGGLFLLGICTVLFLCARRKRKLKPNSSLLTSTMDPNAEETNYNTHIFTYDELKESTRGFHESQKLGRGGFGTVYKGIKEVLGALRCIKDEVDGDVMDSQATEESKLLKNVETFSRDLVTER